MPKNTPGIDPDIIEDVDFVEVIEGQEESATKGEEPHEQVTSSSREGIKNVIEKTRLKEVDKDHLTEEELAKVRDYKGLIDPDKESSADDYGVDDMNDINEIKAELRKTKTGSLGDAGKTLAELNVTIGRQIKGKTPTNKFFQTITNFFAKVEEIAYSQRSIEANIAAFKQLIEQYKSKLDTDLKLLDKITERNDGRYNDLCLLLIAGRDRLEELEQSLAQKEKEINDMESSGIAVDQMALSKLDRDEDFVVALRDQLLNLDQFRAYAVITDKHLLMLSNAIRKMKKALNRGLTHDVAMWEQALIELKIAGEAITAADLSQAVGQTTQEVLKCKSKYLKEAMEKVGIEATRPVLENETFRVLSDDMEKAFNRLREIADEAERKAEEWEKVSESLPALTIGRSNTRGDMWGRRGQLRRKKPKDK